MSGPAPRRGRRSIVLAALGGFLAALLLVGLVGLPLALTHRSELPFERRIASTLVSAVVALSAGDASNPVAGSAGAIATGRAAYTGSCALCHGATGDGRGRFGTSTYPAAADLLDESARSKSDAQLFWITKNGLSFTGMPAFGDVFEDDELWAIVAYLRALQRGTSRPIEVPSPTHVQLLVADPHGDAVARGAATYFAQGCALCHGPTADGPDGLALRGRAGTHVVREGQPGMPAFGPDRISDAQLRDLEAFLLARFVN
ncbi:MAG TPA: c-type cytochrome [Candidatus Limnocylindria bacterium]|nr:c-type cytochrome [Candidatus Limnocylindria bacterium]